MKFRDTVVTILIDSSGSHARRSITIAAMCADILAGRSNAARCGSRSSASPPARGAGASLASSGSRRATPIRRLNDLRHIVYKAATTPGSGPAATSAS